MRRSYFDTLTFNSIKGIAVILLFILHFFASSDLWLPEFRNPSFQLFEKYFCYSANMCVAIFAFLTGYGFWFSSGKNFVRTVRKAYAVLSVYWEIYFLFLAIAAITGIYTEFNIKKIGLSLIGLDENNVIGDIIAFHWYLAFYLAVLVLLPAFHYLLSRRENVLRDIFYLMLAPLFIFSCLGNLVSSFYCLKRFLVDLVLWFPCVGMGYITARYSVFERIDLLFYRLCNKGVKWLRFVIGIFFIALTVYGMYRCPGVIYTTKLPWLLPIVLNMSVFYIILFTYSLAVFFKAIHNSRLQLMLSTIGNISLYMWLFIGIFFNGFKLYTQPFLLLPKYPLFILAWGLVICFMLTKILIFFNNLVIIRASK